jgi:AbrB family looped-hinge helix DNA binding protein
MLATTVLQRAYECMQARHGEVEMIKAKLSTKGQIVIPSAIRRRHHWAYGQSLVIEDTEDGVVLREMRSMEGGLRKLVGIVGYDGDRKSQADMEDAIRKGALALHDRN